MIDIVSSIFNLQFVQINNPILVNNQNEFQIKFGSLGEPSCALISLNLNSNTLVSFTIGSSLLTCTYFYPNENYMGAYNLSNVLSFQLTIPQTGYVELIANFANYLSSNNLLSMELNVVQTLVDCRNPILDIENRAPLFYNPLIYKRNDLFSVVSVIDINCSISLKNIKQWSVFTVDEATGKPTSMLNIDKYEYPELFSTMYYADLVVRPNNLDYGLYTFVLDVTMLSTNKMLFTKQVDTYIKIVPTGLVISALSSSVPSGGGTITITRGFKQEIYFDPILNSYDLDSLATIFNLKFKYYCQVIESGVEMGYSEIYVNKKIDLNMFKLDANLQMLMANNRTCFNTQGKDLI